MASKFDGVDLGEALDAVMQRVRQGESDIHGFREKIAEAEAQLTQASQRREELLTQLQDAWADLQEVLQAITERSEIKGGQLGALLAQPMPAAQSPE